MEKIKEFIKNLSDKGIPLILFRDTSTKQPSISLTILVVSVVMVVLGLIGKTIKALGGIDIDNSLSFFYGASGLYFGRKVSNGKTTIEQQEKK